MKSLGKMGAFTLLSVACLTIMVGCVLAPGLPVIAAGLGVHASASWLITLPALGAVLCAPVAGKLIERQGAHRSLCIGLFLYGLLGFSGIVMRGELQVFADRILLGGATAVVMASGTALISECYEGRARLAMIAKQGMAIELGGVIFLAIGGVLAGMGWRGPFFLYFMSWILLAMVVLFIPSLPRRKEEKADGGLTPASYSKVKDVYFAATLSMTAFFVGVIVLPRQLQQLHVSEAQTGYFLAFISLVAVAAAAAMPQITRRLHEQGTLVLAFVLYAACHLVFALAVSVPMFIAGGILMGCGFGLSVPLVNHMTIERSHPRQRGPNLAYLSMALFLGQFQTSFLEFLPGPASNIFAVAAGFSLIAAAVFALLRLVRRKSLA